MTEPTRDDAILGEDWGDAWDNLPPAPPLLYAQPKNAQITLRLPAQLIAALKAVAASKSLPYHALARSWILEGLRSGQLPDDNGADSEAAPRSSRQMNLKIEPGLLDRLKQFSHETRRPYHQLARQWVEAGVARERPVRASGPRPTLRELMMLLLDGGVERSSAIRGMTRLQKLLFVIQQEIDRESSTFYSYNYGPFDEKVIDSARALQVNGFLTAGQSAAATPPTFRKMMATVLERSEPRSDREGAVFELNEAGRTAAERLRRSNAAYEQLHQRVQQLRSEWDTPDLVERVYEEFPQFTDRSLIKGEVAKRRRRRPM